MKNIKTLTVEHWNRGEFITRGDEPCVGFPTDGAEYVVLSKKDFEKLQQSMSAIFEDESGDLEFVKYKIKEVMSL